MNLDKPWAQRADIFNEAVHPSGQPIQIAAHHGGGGDSMSSALLPATTESWTVQTRRLQDVLAYHRGKYKRTFVKIDIEGGEYELLPDIAPLMADPANSFYISFHHRRLKMALREKFETQEEATEVFRRTLVATVDSFPWKRSITNAAGEALDHRESRLGAKRLAPFSETIVIR